MISKELLESITEMKIGYIRKEDKGKTIAYASRFPNGVFWNNHRINIYELADKCKKWAYKQSSHSTGYAIKTVHYGDSVVGGFIGIEESYIDNCKTECELVFKLCQWILDKKEQK